MLIFSSGKHEAHDMLMLMLMLTQLSAQKFAVHCWMRKLF